MSSEILITEKIEGRWITDLKKRFTVRYEPEIWQNPSRLKDILPSCSALIVRNQTLVTSDIISIGSQLLVIGRAGAGLDNVDVEAATKAGVVVTHTPDQNSISVAELSIGIMLALARMLPSANNFVHGGKWERQPFIGTELYGKTLGIVGLGRIGFLTALRAQALGMSILAFDKYISPDAVAVTETRAELVDLETLLSQSDFVSCHMPLTPDTKHFFNYERFSRMKSTAFFLNMARGGVVDEQGLIRALQDNEIMGAGLDVREQEPPSLGPLSEMENVILTPHIAAFTHEAQERVVTAVSRDVKAILEGKQAQNYVNFSKPKRSASQQVNAQITVKN